MVIFSRLPKSISPLQNEFQLHCSWFHRLHLNNFERATIQESSPCSIFAVLPFDTVEPFDKHHIQTADANILHVLLSHRSLQSHMVSLRCILYYPREHCPERSKKMKSSYNIVTIINHEFSRRLT